MTRIFRYILTHDHGIAPCPIDGLITLATCKPVIRRTARPGDWVVGFRPGSLERGMVLWAGRVAATMPHGEYQRGHGSRPDAQYRELGNGAFERVDAAYHPAESEMRRDLSGPVLLFDPLASRYLNGRPACLSPDLAHLAAAGRGHRVNGATEHDVARFEDWVADLEQGEVATSVSRLGCDGGRPGRAARRCDRCG